MNIIKHLPVFLLVLFILGNYSCANYKINIAQDHQDWQQQSPPDTAQVDFRVFLLGDAGNSPMDGVDPAITALGEHLKEADEQSATIVLGDNIYPYGLASPRNPSARKKSQYRLDKQLEILKPFVGRTIMVPGNHDWGYGLEAVRRQDRYVERYMNKDYEVFLPSNGCGDPQVVELTENLVVIAIDSEWWLQNWLEEPDINDGCDVKSREMFVAYYEEIIKDHKDKNIIVALHHPLYSNGPHGGYFTLKQHLFPLTDLRNNLYIPMPGLGTLVSSLRAVVGTDEDISHPNYQQMRDYLIGVAKKYTKNVMFVSGHEHNLQLFEIDSTNYVISGAGSKQSPARLGNSANFAYGGHGFAIIDVYRDGSMWIEFWIPDAKEKKGKMIFKKQLRGVLPKIKEPAPRTFNEYALKQDSVTITVYPEDEKQIFDNEFWGGLNNDLYYTPITAPVLDLETFQGGLTPIKRGGGVQTNSLQLVDKDGHLYTLRSLRKNVNRTLPKKYNIQLIRDLTNYYYTAANPFGALVVAPLADSIGVYHANPKIYYVPDQPALGKYNDGFGGELYLLEERPDENWSTLSSFGNSERIVGFNKVLEELEEDHKAVIDQRAVLRARLFDMVLGDWDRHYDQWRWAEIDNDNDDIDFYRPVPRDRDMVFSTYDGFLPSILKYTVPFFRAAHNYEAEVKPDRVKWLNYQARGFDKIFLNKMTWSDWQAEAAFIQNNLTDQAIDTGLRELPPAIYQELHKELSEKLKKRRDNLLKFARAQYAALSDVIEVIGTNKQNLFKVTRLPKKVEVVVYEKDDNKEIEIYRRTFLKTITKEIRLYGLDKDDEFIIDGEVKNGILIRCIGGFEEDTFVDRSFVKGNKRKTKFHDAEFGKNFFEKGREGDIETSARPEVNAFLKEDINYNYGLPFPSFSYNPDNGFTLGMQMTFYEYKFKHQNIFTFKGAYSFGNQAVDLGFTGDYKNLFDQYDFLIEAQAQLPQYTFNFFGLGNETVFPNGQDLDFYRIHQKKIVLNPSIKKSLAGSSFMALGMTNEAIQIENTAGRILETMGDDLPSDIFDWKTYSGLQYRFFFDYVDDKVNPTNGILFKTDLGWKANTQNFSKNFGRIASEFTTYFGFGVPRNWVIATRFGVEHLIGDYEFFQAATLGGYNTLRAFNNERFSGRTSFYHTTDLRFRIIQTKGRILPGSIGIHLGADYGRIWLEDDQSQKWHLGYGGGIWFAPLDVFVINTSYFIPNDGDGRFMLNFNFPF